MDCVRFSPQRAGSRLIIPIQTGPMFSKLELALCTPTLIRGQAVEHEESKRRARIVSAPWEYCRSAQLELIDQLIAHRFSLDVERDCIKEGRSHPDREGHYYYHHQPPDPRTARRHAVLLVTSCHIRQILDV